MEKLCQTELRTKRRILLEDSLLALMKERRYQDISVKDICLRAQIPRRTFYHYFGCKESVLHAVVENMLNECSLEVMLEFNAGLNAMRESMIRNFRYWQGPARWKLDLLLDNSLSGEVTRCVLRWLESEHTGVPSVSAADEKEKAIIKKVGASGFFTLLVYWRENEYRETPEEMAEISIRILAKPLFPH